MDENTKEKLDAYTELFDQLKTRVFSEQAAGILLAEIAKDRRMEQIKQERIFNGDAPATENQIAYLQSLGAVIPENLNRQQASKLIESAQAIRGKIKRVIEAPRRIP